MVASHQITREWREYERTNTTVLSAYVQPIAESYLESLERGLAGRGNRGQLYIMQSNCGVDSLAATKAIPITMVESGPASGFWGAAELGRIIGEPNVLALDIGGTTAKCSLIEGGHVRIMTDYWIERSRLSVGLPRSWCRSSTLSRSAMAAARIAWVDDFGKLHVGPHSAGALPGPAAYGRGGVEATTTDANIALGRINKDYFFGGEIKADIDAVEGALGRIAEKLGVERDRGGARHRAHRQQQHDQRAQARLDQSRLRSAGFHSRRVRRRRRHARGGAGRGTRRQESGDPSRRAGLLRLGHDDVGLASRLFRDPPASRRTVSRSGRRRGAGRVDRGGRAARRDQFAAEDYRAPNASS